MDDHPFDRLIIAAPSLQPWWEDFREEGDEIGNLWLHLACALIERRQGRLLPDLPAIAPLIEEYLERYDQQCQVSLGLLESLQGQAEEHGLDTAWMRDVLGPQGRRIWEDLYQLHHQGDLCAVDFDPRHLDGLGPAAVLLDRWMVRPGIHASADSAIAALTISNQSWQLNIRFGCYIDRFVAAEGVPLQAGDRLLYVLPAQETPLKPSPPYAVLAGPDRLLYAAV